MKALLVSIAFPPKRDPECIQTGRYFKYLQASEKVTLSVLTARPPVLHMPVDQTFYCTNFKASKTYQVSIRESRWLNFIERKLNVAKLDQPDSKRTFFSNWQTVAKKIDKPELIYSRSFPLSSTIMAYNLSQHFNVPWIMHLSDPWSWSPLHTYSEGSKDWNLRMEAKCFERADLICLTSNQTIDKYKDLYPEYAQKFSLFPNVYDPAEVSKETFLSSNLEQKEKLKIVYTGGLAGTRSPAPILKFINSLIAQNPSLQTRLEVVFAGDVDRKNRKLLNSYSFVTYLGSLDYLNSLQLIRQADILLAIDSPIGNKDVAVFLPSKLLDYMISGKPIWAVTTRSSATDLFLKEIGGAKMFYYQNHDQVESTSVDHFDFADAQRTILEDYSAPNQAKKLISHFNQLS